MKIEKDRALTSGGKDCVTAIDSSAFAGGRLTKDTATHTATRRAMMGVAIAAVCLLASIGIAN